MKVVERRCANRMVWRLVVGIMTTLAPGTQATTTTIVRATGGDDSWDTASNWDTSVPSGAQNAIVSEGLVRTESNAYQTWRLD